MAAQPGCTALRAQPTPRVDIGKGLKALYQPARKLRGGTGALAVIPELLEAAADALADPLLGLLHELGDRQLVVPAVTMSQPRCTLAWTL